MIPWLRRHDPFPDVGNALTEPNGLLAAGADLSPERLLAAYRRGVFPWYGEGEPILWWSPNPRMVLFPDEVKISRSLAKTLRRKVFQVRFDTDFAAVIRACAEPRNGQDGTWITPAMQSAYLELHELGYAHSVESWHEGRLAGGLYGVAIGRAFYGESMFTKMTDASKVALAHLARHLQNWDFAVIDCQMVTAHLASLGARTMARSRFVEGLMRWTVDGPPRGKWTAVDAATLFGQHT